MCTIVEYRENGEIIRSHCDPCVSTQGKIGSRLPSGTFVSSYDTWRACYYVRQGRVTGGAYLARVAGWNPQRARAALRHLELVGAIAWDDDADAWRMAR